MKLIVQPGNPLRGEAYLPGDKSLSHRAALLAAMAEGESHIQNFLVAGVTQVMLDALARLGVNWHLDGADLTVFGNGMHGWHNPDAPLDCGNSATTLRLLAGALAAANLACVLDGSSGLRRRPMGRIVEPLQLMGVDIRSTGGCAPLTMQPTPRPLHAIDYTLPVPSAQVKSCLLLAALAADGPTTLREPAPSRDHTERMLRGMGVQVTSQENVTILYPPSRLTLPPLHTTLPGDISAAAFLIVAALITPGAQLTLRQVELNPTRTGLLDALWSMGGDITLTRQAELHGEPVGDLVIRYSPLQGTRVAGAQVVRMIDEFPAFAVAAAYARGETIVAEAEELRQKESDRITALCQELGKLGAQLQETPDGFRIHGQGYLAGGTASSHGDHRLAMALGVAGLAARRPVTVNEAQSISESFPGFVQTLTALGGDLYMQDSDSA